ncbi:MAG: MepB family protein [Pseudomonadota bacterium]
MTAHHAPASIDTGGTSGAHAVHPDLLAIQTQVYRPLGLACSAPEPEAESADYGATTFALDGAAVRFRVAKTTPTKVGQFVTLWKRLGKGPIQPFDVSDAVDCFVVSTRTQDHFGQFVFPKTVLCARDIVSIHGTGGKRAMRVYPPWDNTTSRQAAATQRWQLEFFLDLTPGLGMDEARARQLYFQGRESNHPPASS